MLSAFPTEPVSLHKLNGEIFDNVKALVDSKAFFIEDTTVNIEEGDYFVRNLPNGSSEIYRVTDRGFFKGMSSAIPDHYQTKIVKVSRIEMEQDIKHHNHQEKGTIMLEDGHENLNKTRKVLISHSSKDKDYMQLLVELLEDIGLPEGSIVCSSVPGYGIPGGQNIYDWLRKQFLECDLHVIFALSYNYYESAASLNEMGAAWLTKATYSLLVLPGFEFNDIKGCVDPREAGTDLGGEVDELKHRLGELKDTLIAEFNLPHISGTKWERHRDDFIRKTNEVTAKRKEAEKAKSADVDSSKASSEFHLSKEDINRIADVAAPKWENFGETESNPIIRGQSLSHDAMILLAYASKNGEIMILTDLSGTSVGAGKWNFVRAQDRREVARWESAVNELNNKGFIKLVGRKDKIYNLTDAGYKVADVVIEQNKIDFEKSPEEYLDED